MDIILIGRSTSYLTICFNPSLFIADLLENHTIIISPLLYDFGTDQKRLI
ncbi:hypothetical protein [Robertkochia sediminum]|nr:hypothetical protein [Robertkochia sediminum]MBL7471550.1 hypothetical protein [Robertkochia sediminum]